MSRNHMKIPNELNENALASERLPLEITQSNALCVCERAFQDKHIDRYSLDSIILFHPYFLT